MHSVEYKLDVMDTYKGFWFAWRKLILLCLLGLILWAYAPYYRKNLWFFLMYSVPIPTEISLYLMRMYFSMLGYIAYLVLFAFVYSIWSIWKCNNNLKGQLGMVNVAILNERLDVTFQGAQTVIEWKYINSIRDYGPYIYVRSQMVGMDLMLWIPRKAFKTEEDANAFRRQIVKCYLDA